MLSPMRGMAKGYYAKVASSAVVAGTVSSITGGKFANGALSGAFRFMFNEAMHKNNGFVSGIKKGFIDLYDGIMSVPKAMYNYGNYLGRITGFRDWQNDNILPWNKWEAQLEYKVLEYGIKNYPVDIAKAIGKDFLNRPVYYIAGSFYAPGASLSGLTMRQSIMFNTSVTSNKIIGTAVDYVHTEVNPLH